MDKLISAEYFEEKTGIEPIHDDLERCNCQKAGTIGHMACGWCVKCEMPVFMCSHFFPTLEPPKQPE